LTERGEGGQKGGSSCGFDLVKSDSALGKNGFRVQREEEEAGNVWLLGVIQRNVKEIKKKGIKVFGGGGGGIGGLGRTQEKEGKSRTKTHETTIQDLEKEATECEGITWAWEKGRSIFTM